MKKDKIIETLAQNKTVEKIIKKINDSDKELLNDFAQQIYLELLMKDADIIEKAYEEKKLLNYIKRMIFVQYNSKTSPLYINYRKYNQNKQSIETLYDRI